MPVYIFITSVWIRRHN